MVPTPPYSTGLLVQAAPPCGPQPLWMNWALPPGAVPAGSDAAAAAAAAAAASGMVPVATTGPAAAPPGAKVPPNGPNQVGFLCD